MDTIYKGTIGNINVDTLILTDKAGNGDCIIRPVASGSWTAQGFKVGHTSLSVSTIINRNDSGGVFDNTTAAGTITATLPDASGVPGISFTFIRTSANEIRIDPPVVNKIIYSGGNMSLGEYLALTSLGAKLSVISILNGDYVATQEFGILTEETP